MKAALLPTPLDYAAQGVAIFPLVPRGKIPLIKREDGGHGFQDATTDPEQISAWWTATPTANIGRATGKPYGVLVIEDDPRHDGPASLARLAAEYGPLPLTYMVKSGGGGHHRYFRFPAGVDYIKSLDNRFGADYPGVDVKADGGYVVAPPSIHPNSKRYTVVADAPLAELPSSWLDALLASQPAKPTLPPHVFDGTEAYKSDGQRWLDWAIDKKREGTADHYGFLLAQQLLVNHVADPRYFLSEYAISATSNVDWPFDDRDISRWIASAEGSRIVQGGQPARTRDVDDSGFPPDPGEEVHEIGAGGGDGGDDGEGEAKGKKQREPSQATKIIDLVKRLQDEGRGLREAHDREPPLTQESEAAEELGLPASVLAGVPAFDLYHDDHGDAHAAVPVETGGAKHREVYRVASSAFKLWLVHQFWTRFGTTPGHAALTDAVLQVEAMARFEGAARTIWNRTAQASDSTSHLWLDLGDPLWRVVLVTAMGWRVMAPPADILFERPPGYLALPEPHHNAGELRKLLAPFVNLRAPDEDGDDWYLLAAWLLAALRPYGPYPVLQLRGEQGSAKSTHGRILRSLIDPNEALLRSEPREARDLWIAARNGWVVAFDNMSRLRSWLSNELCRLSTGMAAATRQLYSDSDEVIFKAERPCLLTGIEGVVTASDLIDRTITLSLPRIDDAHRRDEKSFYAAFREQHPAILGALLDAVSAALRAEPDVTLDRKPRMADFAVWGVAIERSQGWPAGAFLRTYAHEREQANEVALEASPIALTLIAWIREQPGNRWEGSAGQLRDELMRWLARTTAVTSGVDTKVTLPHGWPHTPRAMVGALDQVKPNLRNVGVTITPGRRTAHSRTYTIEYTKGGPEPSQPSYRHLEAAEPESMWSDEMTVDDNDDGPTVMSNGNRHATNPDVAWVDDGNDGYDGRKPPSTNGHKPAAQMVGPGGTCVTCGHLLDQVRLGSSEYLPCAWCARATAAAAKGSAVR